MGIIASEQMKKFEVGVVLAAVFFVGCKEPNPEVCCVRGPRLNKSVD